MNCNRVINAMAQQADMLKQIEEVIAHDEKQASSAVTLEEMTALKNYMNTMKTACTVATALAKHYASENKPKEASFETDDPTETDEPKDKPARTRNKKEKEKASSNKQAPPVEEPQEEDDDLDFLD